MASIPAWVISAVLLGFGLWLALFGSPVDYRQGELVRVMYIHVPPAWISQMLYAVMGAGAIEFIIWRTPMAIILVRAIAPIGAVYTIIAIVTGALWGQPTWGTWWAWDARLTSMLILLFLYGGVIGIWSLGLSFHRAGLMSSLIAVTGLINLPIIKFSVEWWSTLHQGSSILPRESFIIYLSFGASYVIYLILRAKTGRFGISASIALVVLLAGTMIASISSTGSLSQISSEILLPLLVMFAGWISLTFVLVISECRTVLGLYRRPSRHSASQIVITPTSTDKPSILS